MTIEKLVTPAGRLVWGHPLIAKEKKNQQTNQTIMKDGKPVMQYSFGVAYDKNTFHQQILPYLQQEAATGYPHGVPPTFSWKYKDGDGVDRKGKPYRDREGYAGCYVLNINTEAFAPPVYKFENGQYRQLAANEIKTGDYISVSLNIKVNVPTNSTFTPGLYINPNVIELVGYGPEIVGVSSDPTEHFGGRQHQLPPGASATPISSAPANVGHPGQAIGPAPVAGYPPAAPVQQYQPQPVQSYAPQPAQPLPPPAHDFVRQATGAPAPVGNAVYPAVGQPPQQYPAAQPAGYAPAVTTSHGNGLPPGMPQSR